MSSTTVAGKPGLDPTLPNVTMILGGVERHLVYDFNAICLVEKEAGLNLVDSLAKPDSATLRALLYAALKREYPELTLEQVGGWIRPKLVFPIFQALTAAWSESNRGDEDDVPGEAGAQAPPNA